MATRQYRNLAANGTTTLVTGRGILHSIVVNTVGASANTVTVYDNSAASGTKIATLDSVNGRGSFSYEAYFGTGLTVVIATGTAADITVVFSPL